ncbi:MAG: DNA repair protein RadA [Trueperaceae bacterium]
MPKSSVDYLCSDCGTSSPVSLGRCPRCGSWASMQPRPQESSNQRAESRRGRVALVQPLEEVSEAELYRHSSGNDEVDRVLGGGWVSGSVLLLAGEPGIGKSTLLLQLAHLAAENQRTSLYVAGEESAAQVRLRADRLGLAGGLQLTRETDARALAAYLRSEPPQLTIVDSIQTLTAEDAATPGTLTQVRDSTALLVAAAKETGSTLVLIGHVTKQGSIAGPKVVEHMVDATLSLESAAGYRVLRAIKNRFGPAGEMGVFEMTGEGMRTVPNPSEAFLSERPLGVPGSVVAATLEGQRPLLLEVQALAAKSPYASPRRVVQGLDSRRVDVVLAVLERRLELPLTGLDIFVNVAGGLRLTDPGTDLAVALAVYSAVTNQVLPDETAVLGEVGLAGEVRAVTQQERRRSEAVRSGFGNVIEPAGNSREAHGIRSVHQAVERVWGTR